MQWSLKACNITSNAEDLFLHFTVRFRDHKQDEVIVPITTRRGNWQYIIKDKDYLQSGGIVTYYAEIQKASCVIATWKHPLWTEWIAFPEYAEEDCREHNTNDFSTTKPGGVW